jgi:hypothetical protein
LQNGISAGPIHPLENLRVPTGTLEEVLELPRDRIKE